MWYCDKIKRECTFSDICNMDNNSIHVEKKYDKVFYRRNIANILFELWIKKVWKLELIKFHALWKMINKYKDKYHIWVYSFNDTYNQDEFWRIIDSKEIRFTLILTKIRKYIKSYTVIDNSDKREDNVLWTWLLLWYPKCCIKSEFKKTDVEYFKNINVVRDLPIFNDGIVCKLLNPFIRLYSHRWCSNSCIKTIEDSEKVLKYLQLEYWNDIVKYYFSYINKKIEWKKK